MAALADSLLPGMRVRRRSGFGGTAGLPRVGTVTSAPYRTRSGRHAAFHINVLWDGQSRPESVHLFRLELIDGCSA